MIVIDEEFKKLIPPLTADEFAGLEKSLLDEGCRDALVLWGDTLVDGHNRYEICTKYHIPFETVQKEFASRDDVMIWMIDTQFSRRNMEKIDMILLAKKKAPILERMAKKNLHLASGGDRKSEHFKKSEDHNQENQGLSKLAKVDFENKTAMIEPIHKNELKPEPSKPIHVREEVAKMAGVSSGTVAMVEQIQKKKPEMIESIRKHEVSINQAYQAIKREEKETAREEKRLENAVKIETLHTPLEAQGLFQTIVIDPPWDWGDEGDVNQFGRAKPDYHTMPIEDIAKLPIGKISDENCHLYLWVTNRSLPKAFRLIEAWGFRYITCITWVKPSIGMGNYFRGDTEQVLFAVKGSQPLKRRDVGTHFNAPRGVGHSAKPDEFYKLIESCSYAPYIDIFGRKGRDGWSVWGENG